VKNKRPEDVSGSLARRKEIRR